MKTPTAPQSGAPVTANWGREVCDALRRMRLQAGPGIRLNQTPEGTTISAARAPASQPATQTAVAGDAWIGVISHDQSGNLIATAVSANGPALPAILNLTDALVADDLPDGSQVIVHPIAVRQYLAEVPA